MTTDQRSLLPCPFCGGDAAMGTIKYSSATIREQNWGQDTFHKVNCVACGSTNLGLVGYRTPEKAAQHWNTRAALPSERPSEPTCEEIAPGCIGFTNGCHCPACMGTAPSVEVGSEQDEPWVCDICGKNHDVNMIHSARASTGEAARRETSGRRWRKRPVVIEAVQYTPETRDECIAFCDAGHTSIDDDGGEYELANLRIATLEGVMTCAVNVWIIKGVKGEFYPCKPDIFAATYEPADASHRAALPDVADSVSPRTWMTDVELRACVAALDAVHGPPAASVEAEPEPSDDLVRRLRSGDPYPGLATMHEAADAIEAQGREIVRLTLACNEVARQVPAGYEAEIRTLRNAAVTASEREERTRKALQELIGFADERFARHGNKPYGSPGHSHSRPGIWDDDNGALAGKTCKECMAWNNARLVALKPATGEQKASVDTSGAASNGQPDAGGA